MLSPVSKVLLALSGVGLVFGLAYAAVVDERSGTVLLLFLAVAALVAVVATAGAAVPDEAPVVPAEARRPERGATTMGSPVPGSAWPAASALAVAVLAASAAAGGPVVIAGVIAVAVATAGWFAKVWSEDPTWTPRVRERVSMRLVVPVGLPVAMFLLAATIAVSMSRILLAISKNAAVGGALVVAVAILGACAWVASRPRVASSAIIALAVLAVVSTAAMGVTGTVAGERDFEVHEEHGEALRIRAKGTKFDKSEITVPAGEEEVEIEFVNEDEEVYHNVAVYEGEGPEAAPVFNGEGFPGQDERTYRLETPPPGTYVFVCDFHPNMKGALVVGGS